MGSNFSKTAGETRRNKEKYTILHFPEGGRTPQRSCFSRSWTGFIFLCHTPHELNNFFFMIVNKKWK